jgi:hypothetical protein
VTCSPHSPPSVVWRREGNVGRTAHARAVWGSRQVIGLDPEHVRVVERHINSDESAVFIELAGIDCKVTLAGRLYPLQQVTAEMAHQLAQIEQAQRAAAGQ